MIARFGSLQRDSLILTGFSYPAVRLARGAPAHKAADGKTKKGKTAWKRLKMIFQKEVWQKIF